jgi:glucose-1-phosphate cytidylyltransferase
MLEQEPIRALAESRELQAFRHEGFWQPMDTYREYELLNGLWESGAPPWVVPHSAPEPSVT